MAMAWSSVEDVARRAVSSPKGMYGQPAAVVMVLISANSSYVDIIKGMCNGQPAAVVMVPIQQICPTWTSLSEERNDSRTRSFTAASRAPRESDDTRSALYDPVRASGGLLDSMRGRGHALRRRAAGRYAEGCPLLRRNTLACRRAAGCCVATRGSSHATKSSARHGEEELVGAWVETAELGPHRRGNKLHHIL